MMLKKQTVWLLTMLSLIIVLSVYYMTSPPADQLAANGVQDEPKKEKSADGGKDKPKSSDDQAGNEQAAATDAGKEVNTTAVGKAVFASAKEKRLEARAELQEQYMAVINSDQATAQEIAQARDKLTALNQMSSKEKMLESLIVAGGYGEGALVNVQDDKIKIFVQAGELSNKQAAQIIDLVEDKVNMSTHKISVTFKAPNQ